MSHVTASIRNERAAMFIETEDTPNPATLKFLPGRTVTGHRGTADFANAEAARGRSLLAEAIFGLPHVTGVFLGTDFISVTKDGEIAWGDLKPQVLGTITEHFASGRPVIEGEGVQQEDVIAPEDEAVVAQIRELLDTRVRPAVAGDGGDIVFRGYREGIVRLTMQGACAGCPSSRATLKHGVENMLRHYVPEVVAVEQVED